MKNRERGREREREREKGGKRERQINIKGVRREGCVCV